MATVNQRALRIRDLGSAFLILFQPLQPLLNARKIGERELHQHAFHLPRRIQRLSGRIEFPESLDHQHKRIRKAEHGRQRIKVRGIAAGRGRIAKYHFRGGEFLGLEQVPQCIDADIRHFYRAVSMSTADREMRAGRRGCQRVKDRGLPGLRCAHEIECKRHGCMVSAAERLEHRRRECPGQGPAELEPGGNGGAAISAARSFSISRNAR